VPEAGNYDILVNGGDSMAKISKERKVTYYVGLGMIVLGFILFISTFFEAAGFGGRIMGGDPFMGDPFTGDSFMRDADSSFSRAIIGMIFIIAGAIVASIGAKGAAGSGLLLDPEKAREDLKPFNEAKGGMINDVVSNIDVVDRMTRPQGQKEIIKIRCRNCDSLNDEDARFCKSCGREI
jgi:hypothetical protein